MCSQLHGAYSSWRIPPDSRTILVSTIPELPNFSCHDNCSACHHKWCMRCNRSTLKLLDLSKCFRDSQSRLQWHSALSFDALNLETHQGAYSLAQLITYIDFTFSCLAGKLINTLARIWKSRKCTSASCTSYVTWFFSLNCLRSEKAFFSRSSYSWASSLWFNLL